MSREVEIDGIMVQVVTIADICPNGLGEWESLVKSVAVPPSSFWPAETQERPSEQEIAGE